MLSRRQQFRKLVTASKRMYHQICWSIETFENDLIETKESTGNFCDAGNLLKRGHYSGSTTPLTTPCLSIASDDTDDGLASNELKVRFSDEVQVFVIPSRQDLEEYLGDMHYTTKECQGFQLQALIDIYEYSLSPECRRKRNHLLKSGLLDLSLALTSLNASSMWMKSDSVMDVTNLTIMNRTHYLKSCKHMGKHHSMALLFYAHADKLLLLNESCAHNTMEINDIIHKIFSKLYCENHLIHMTISTHIHQPCTLKEACLIIYQPWTIFDDHYYSK